MPHKSDTEPALPAMTVQYLSADPVCAEFDVDAADAVTLRVEAHAPGVFRLRLGQGVPARADGARGAAQAAVLLARDEAVGEMTLDTLADGWRLVQGDTALTVYQDGRIALARQDQPLTELVCRQLDGQWQVDATLDDDVLCGLGETSAALDRRGEQLYTDRPDLRVLPLGWSTRGWGLYPNTLARVAHDLDSQGQGRWRLTIDDGLLDLFCFVAEPVDILNQYTALTGRGGQPSLWPMGVWLAQQPGQPLDAVLDVVRGFREQGLGLDAVSLAWPAPVRFQSDKPLMEWQEDRVDDARALFTHAAALDVHVAAPVFPGVLHGTELFDEWEDRGWLLTGADGLAQVFPGCPATNGAAFGLLDLTHKDAYRLWAERHRQLQDDGLGAPRSDVWLDFPDEVESRAGVSGARLRSLYPALVRQALFDAYAGHRTPQEGVVLSTDLFPSVQRYAWQVDEPQGNDWSDMADSLRRALSLGNSAVPVQVSAIGRADAPAMPAERYIRWLAQAVFSANFSFQAAPPLLPQAFDEATRELVQHWLQWRYRLIPYVLGIIEDGVRSGLPVQRAMTLAFPADPQAHLWDTQYMLGPALLVAPVFEPGDMVQVYLPEGSAWWDLNTGHRYEGGTTWTYRAALNTLPVFGREGHMLCLGPTAQHTGEFNSARLLEEVWMFGMPEHSPVVMRNKIRVMQMQGSSYIKGLEGLRILPSEGLEVKRRGAEVRISRAR